MMALGGFLLACFAAASTSAAFKPGPWYQSLRKPFWTPPDWLFSVAWTILYLMMAVAGWLVWRDVPEEAATLPLIAFAVQLALNALWAPVFFGAHRMALGFVVMMLLWVAVLATIVLFLRVQTIAGLLLIPYAFWVIFAAFLNLGIWVMNADRANAGDPLS
nr:TspO/MBR family protein [Roseospira visakhapatnamensis]